MTQCGQVEQPKDANLPILQWFFAFILPASPKEVVFGNLVTLRSFFGVTMQTNNSYTNKRYSKQTSTKHAQQDVEPSLRVLAWKKEREQSLQNLKTMHRSRWVWEGNAMLYFFGTLYSVQWLRSSTSSLHQTTCNIHMHSFPSMLVVKPYLEWGFRARRCHTQRISNG